MLAAPGEHQHLYRERRLPPPGGYPLPPTFAGTSSMMACPASHMRLSSEGWLGLSSPHAESMMKRSVSTRRLAFHTGSLWQLRADNDTVSCAYRTQDEDNVRQLALEVSEPWYKPCK